VDLSGVEAMHGLEPCPAEYETAVLPGELHGPCVRAVGIEPTTSCVSDRCSHQPSYTRIGLLGGIRTHDFQIRNLTPYPLGHEQMDRLAGVEPASRPWQGRVMTVRPQPDEVGMERFERSTSRTQTARPTTGPHPG
jgi:hypothetical protein